MFEQSAPEAGVEDRPEALAGGPLSTLNFPPIHTNLSLSQLEPTPKFQFSLLTSRTPDRTYLEEGCYNLKHSQS